MVVFYHQLENHHHLMEARLVLWSGWGASEEGQGRGMAGGLWRSLGWGRALSQEGVEKGELKGGPALWHTCLSVADITQEQDLLQPLLIEEDIAQGVFVIEFFNVAC